MASECNGLCVFETGHQRHGELIAANANCPLHAVQRAPLASNLISLPPMDSDEAAPILAAMERAIRDMAPVTPLVGAQFAYEAIRSFMPSRVETTTEPHPDTARLDFIEADCIELRCKESRNHDDADVYYEAVKFFMQIPRERPVGRGTTPREAIDAAMENDDDECCYCGQERNCTACSSPKTSCFVSQDRFENDNGSDQ